MEYITKVNDKMENLMVLELNLINLKINIIWEHSTITNSKMMV